MSNRHRILVACMPKSGSTYLSSVLSGLPGFAVTSWVPEYGRREQELCPQRLRADRDAYGNFNLVAQHHVRYSEVTKQYLREFNLKPVVLVRNLFDVVPSLIDHHRAESVVYPMAFVPDDIVGWEFERAAGFVTHMVIPWYFNFFVSWDECPEKILITYDDLAANPIKVVRDICAHYGVTASERDIAGAVEGVKTQQTRKNVGVSGRGAGLPEHCKDCIREMASYYERMDFSKIGISR